VTEEALEQLFEQVRRVYFPRWRRGKSWSVRFGTPPGRSRDSGYCDSETRTIWIAVDDEKVELVIIHEITHAIVPGHGHGVRFQRRMQKAADDAEAQGNAALAAALRHEVAICAASPVHHVSYVYGEIRDHAWEFADYEALLHWLSEENGWLLEEFEKHYPRARRVFDQERRRFEKEERRNREFLARVKGGSHAM
jgi:hypothetical protein